MCQKVRQNEKEELKAGEEWITKLDINAFAKDIKELGKKLEKQQGIDDVNHLNKMVNCSNSCYLVAMLTMGFCVNPISIIGFSLFTFSRWTMIAHHTCHGGYDKCHPNKGRWNRFKFGISTFWRRFNDWFDWMMPEAWNIEHNNRHHFHLSEVDDPDLVEMNLSDLRESTMPMPLKYLQVLGAMLTWKWFYYSPNTYKELKLAKLRREGKPIPKGVNPEDAVTITSVLSGTNPFYSATELFAIVLGPYILLHFFIFPLPLLWIGNNFDMGYGLDGATMYWNAVKNLFFAEMLTNLHGFVAVVTNHAGDDMYRFRDGCRPHSGSFYLRQVLASVDFAMGDDLTDFMHGWLNYQIEHHLWPNLSMLSYQKSAPMVRELCAKHGVPYIKENVFIRLKKTIDIMVGNTSMKWFPAHYEKEFLKADANLELSKRLDIQKLS
eukprot:CAMPEP_0194146422 /NCGR_PEP_ID=MMETSP0152-20130528/20578_1 /TAXON_ID=1049557 /ORGANISM="Thalassiothrix antarctica, Strain L6-D1" /LENGTH=435 /DNA_ID=CAMNT_0038846939 /DNA_START=118 /DNA_END=1425 /DNA_ORIENTATION=-